MLPSSLFLTLLVTLPVLAISAEQIPITVTEDKAQDNQKPKRIAIIGAGIAGASAAYFLNGYNNRRLPLDITVYEAASQAGGRIKSARVYDGAYGSQHAETGAHTFYSDDWCLQSAIDEVGLRQKLEPHYPVQKTVGVWDGQNFILRRESDLKSSTWRDLARSIWRYGLSPRRLRDLVAAKHPQIGRLFGRFEYQYRTLPEFLHYLGLRTEHHTSAEEYLLKEEISSAFSMEVVEATTRAWFARDLDDLNALSALVAMNPSKTDFLWDSIGGNYRLIYRMLKLSEAEIHLNSRVARIAKAENGGYQLSIEPTGHANEPSSTLSTAYYDAILIATPLQGSGLDLDLGGVHVTNARLTPYVERHVTHFTSPESTPLSLTYFNVSSADEMPDRIFTTKRPTSTDDDDFFSIEHSRAYRGVQGCILESENLYKVVSATPVEDRLIAKLLGRPQNSTLEELGVEWVHRQVWPNASPEFPLKGALLDKIGIADGIFYTGVSDEIVSSLEMSCRMGEWAASLLRYSLVTSEVEP
jgi:Prenylcysteine lyase/NAD(P)-binding Rossmann-like domain